MDNDSSKKSQPIQGTKAIIDRDAASKPAPEGRMSYQRIERIKPSNLMRMEKRRLISRTKRGSGR